MFSEISQMQKNIYFMISLMGGTWNSLIHRDEDQRLRGVEVGGGVAQGVQASFRDHAEAPEMDDGHGHTGL